MLQLSEWSRRVKRQRAKFRGDRSSRCRDFFIVQDGGRRHLGFLFVFLILTVGTLN